MPGASLVIRTTLLIGFCLPGCSVVQAQATSASARTSTAKSLASKKKATAGASKRPSSKNVKVSLAGSSRHPNTNANGSGAALSSSARVRNRRVVVTRKLVHGHWVRTTQIVRADPGPTYQAHPEPERYQQIQQALAQKGYFKGEPNGQWGDDSVAALKQYQTDQKIPNDGKLSALSIIGLGLGPSREAAPPTSKSSTLQ